MKPSRLLAAAVTMAAVALPTTITTTALAAEAPVGQRVCEFGGPEEFSAAPVPLPITEAGRGESSLTVPVDAIATDRYTGEVSVRLGKLDHVVTYERWNLLLKSPTGAEVALMGGSNTTTVGTRLTMEHVEFVTDGSAKSPAEHEGPLVGTQAAPLRLQAKDSLLALMGAEAEGDWTLVVEDVFGDIQPRRAGRATGDSVGTFDGNWSLTIKDTDCKSQPPIATATLDPKFKVAIVGQRVVFTAAASSDPDKLAGADQGLTYEWSTDGGTTWHETSGPEYDPVFTTPGTQTVILRVTDSSGVSSDVSFTVNATAAPTPVITATTLAPAVGQQVTFSAAGSSDDGTIVKYQWAVGKPDWGPSAAEYTTAFQSSGTVQVFLKVTDELGAENFTSVNVNVAGGNGGPVAPPAAPGTTQPPAPMPGTGTGGGGAPAAPTPGTDATVLPDGGFGGATPPAEAVAADGFSALLSAASKHKSKKAIKKGVAVKFTLSAPGEVTVRLMANPKDAKKAGVKLKGKKPVAIATGRVELEQAGAAKVTLKVKKKYRTLFTKLKKTKKLRVVVRAVAASADSGSELAVAKSLSVTK